MPPPEDTIPAAPDQAAPTRAPKPIAQVCKALGLDETTPINGILAAIESLKSVKTAYKDKKFAALVDEIMRANIKRPDAEFIAGRQIRHDNEIAAREAAKNAKK